MFHLRQGDRQQVGSLSWSSTGRVHRGRCAGCARSQALLLQTHASLPCRPHRETSQLRAAREITQPRSKETQKMENLTRIMEK